MKNVIRIVFASVIAFSQPLFAQTNTFPSSGNVGIGNLNPERILHISQNGGTAIVIEGASNGSSTNPFISLRRSRGTLLSPSGILLGNTIGQINIQGRHSSGWDGIRRVLEITATENWTDGSEGFAWDFYTRSNGSGGAPSLAMRLDHSGHIGIGTTSPEERLTVAGTIKSQEVIVEENTGADFVFEEGYELPDLSELETFIKSNKHLPEIPTAEQMKEEGVKVGELQIKLLQKIEELTLYAISQEKTLKQQTTENKKLKYQINKQQKLIDELFKRMNKLESGER